MDADTQAREQTSRDMKSAMRCVRDILDPEGERGHGSLVELVGQFKGKYDDAVRELAHTELFFVNLVPLVPEEQPSALLADRLEAVRKRLALVDTYEATLKFYAAGQHWEQREGGGVRLLDVGTTARDALRQGLPPHGTFVPDLT